MARSPIPSHLFALVVLRHSGRYLLVHEAKHGQTWYLPAGRVEPGEDFATAAVRETIEEAGVVPRLLGILRIEHACGVDPGAVAASRVRVVFLAEPAGATAPKRTADRHSLEARWVAPSELHSLDLRHPEVHWLLEGVERGQAVLPLSAYVGQAASTEPSD